PRRRIQISSVRIVAMDLTSIPVVWAQAGTPTATATSLRWLVLRRWFTSLTLSSPPSDVPSHHAVWAGAAGIIALLLLALVVQGPLRALGQIVDVPGHLRLLALAIGRLRRCGRVVAVTIGMTVIAWTASQSFTYNRAL